MKRLYATEARSIGDARNGTAYLTDKSVELDMALPVELGGTGNGMNPEQLFALGYSTCFHQALKHIAKQKNLDATASSVVARVNLNQDDQGEVSLAISLEVSLPYVQMAQAHQMARAAHTTCPYSKAVHGNIDVQITLLEE